MLQEIEKTSLRSASPSPLHRFIRCVHGVFVLRSVAALSSRDRREFVHSIRSWATDLISWIYPPTGFQCPSRHPSTLPAHFKPNNTTRPPSSLPPLPHEPPLLPVLPTHISPSPAFDELELIPQITKRVSPSPSIISLRLTPHLLMAATFPALRAC